MTAAYCAAPRHGGQMVPAPNGAWLCDARDGCRQRLRRDLRDLPGLYVLLGEYHATDDSGDDATSPADHRHHIKALLVSWCKAVAEERARPPRRPGESLAGYASRIERLDGHAPYPADTVPAIAGWLYGQCGTGRHGYIPAHRWAGEMAGDFAEAWAKAMGILNPMRVRNPLRNVPLTDRRCPQCPDGYLFAHIPEEDDDRRRSFVACDVCGHEWEASQLLRLGHDLTARREAVGA